MRKKIPVESLHVRIRSDINKKFDSYLDTHNLQKNITIEKLLISEIEKDEYNENKTNEQKLETIKFDAERMEIQSLVESISSRAEYSDVEAKIRTWAQLLNSEWSRIQNLPTKQQLEKEILNDYN